MDNSPLIKLTIATDNAAFDDNPSELSRILHQAADKVANGIESGDYIRLMDINGNQVGQIEALGFE